MACDDEAGGGEGVAGVVGRAVEHGLLRPALELAVVVARTAAEARPPIPPPGPLRPLLRHAKWTPRTMASVARVLDTDDEFRRRVAEAAQRLDPQTLGTPSRLYLERHDGWEKDLAESVRESDEVVDRRRTEQQERQASRQLSGLTAEIDRLQGEIDAVTSRAATTEYELVEQRRERREALARVDDLTVALASAQAAEQLWRHAAEAAEQSGVAQEKVLQAAEEELEALRVDRHRMAERIVALVAELASAVSDRDAQGAAAAQVATAAARAVADAADAAEALAVALEVAARSLASGHPTAALRPNSAGWTARAAAAAGAGAGVGSAPGGRLVRPLGETPGSARPGPAQSRRPQRRPMALPPAVFEDSAEAAAHLVHSGVLLLVDGYNVSLFAWPELTLPAQRERMTTALAELAARSGAVIQVVFDGDERLAYPTVRGTPRRPVRIVFSAPGVDADEVIIGLVDDQPPDQPVVVATNDRRVQTEVRSRGANVVTTPQLLGLLRRAGPRN